MVTLDNHLTGHQSPQEKEGRIRWGKKDRIHINWHHISKKRSCWRSTPDLPPSMHRLLWRLLLELHEQTAGTLAHGPATPSVARLCHLQHYVWKSFQRAYVKPHNFLCWWYFLFLDQYPASHPKFCRLKKHTSWFSHFFNISASKPPFCFSRQHFFPSSHLLELSQCQIWNFHILYSCSIGNLVSPTNGVAEVVAEVVAAPPLYPSRDSCCLSSVPCPDRKT